MTGGESIAGIARHRRDRNSKIFNHKGHPFDSLTLAQGRLWNTKNEPPGLRKIFPPAILEAFVVPLFSTQHAAKEPMAALIDAIDIKRKMFFELDGTPFHCLEVNSPTARGGQTLVRLKMRNLLTRAVFDKTFKASDKFKEPDLEMVPASFLYSDADGFYFMDQESFETLTLSQEMTGDAQDFLGEGLIIQVHKYNGNPIGLQLPPHVELTISHTEPGVRGDSSSGSVTKPATLETGLEIRVPLFIKQGEKVRVSTETGEFVARA
jgi:elongation factor P